MCKDKMFVAVALGVALGIVGFAPLIFCVHKAKVTPKDANLSGTGILLLGLLASFLILGASIIAVAVLARDIMLPFALSTALSLVLTSVIYGISKSIKKK